MKDYKTFCTDKIAALLPNITQADKLHTQKNIPISQPTLDKYLRGDITKLDTAIKIIEVLTGRVNDRYKELKAVSIS